MLEVHQQQEDGVDAPLVSFQMWPTFLTDNSPHHISDAPGTYSSPNSCGISQHRLSTLTLMTSSFTPLARGFPIRTGPRPHSRASCQLLGTKGTTIVVLTHGA